MKMKVAPALVAVLLMAGLFMPAPPAHALAPWIIMAGIKLLDFGLQESTKQERSEVGSMSVANLALDGQIVAGTPTAGLAELVTSRVDGHSVILLVETQADVVPSICSDFTEVRVGCNRFPDFTITAEMAAELAASRRGSGARPQREHEPERSSVERSPIQSGINHMRRNEDQSSQPRRRQDDGVERDWVVPIDINELEFGQYLFRLDYFFRNGGKRDSFAVFIHLFVTDLQTLQEGVNSPVIQQELAMTGGMWSPIPAITPLRIPVTPEAAAANGMARAAQAAGIPQDGTVTTTTTEIGQFYGAAPAPQVVPSQPTNWLAEVCEMVGYDGDPNTRAPVFRPNRSLEHLPLVIYLRSSDQRVIVNGREEVQYRPGFLLLWLRAGQKLEVDIDGTPFFRGNAPAIGTGLWLNAR